MPEPFVADIEFNKLCGREDVEMIGAMLELAADAYPDLERDACRREISRLQQAAIAKLAGAPANLADRLIALAELLYVHEGFHGNRQSYYDPRNSYLNEVLNRRCGIPITLGIVYMAVAAGAGVAVHGVPTPGHFMLLAERGSQRWFVDPFSRGELLDQESCRDRLEEMLGRPGPVSEDWFRPASNLEIVVRVLRNLKAAYAMDDRWSEALTVQQRCSRCCPINWMKSAIWL